MKSLNPQRDRNIPTPVSLLARACTTLNRLAAAAGVTNLDYLGDREEQLAFLDDVGAAHAAILGVMRLLKNHPELGYELSELTAAEIRLLNLRMSVARV